MTVVISCDLTVDCINSYIISESEVEIEEKIDSIILMNEINNKGELFKRRESGTLPYYHLHIALSSTSFTHSIILVTPHLTIIKIVLTTLQALTTLLLYTSFVFMSFVLLVILFLDDVNELLGLFKNIIKKIIHLVMFILIEIVHFKRNVKE